jgi:hypothetical protein
MTMDMDFKDISLRRMLVLTASAAFAGVMIVLGFVLPAEFHHDPLGLGKLSGVDALWAPPELKAKTNGVSGTTVSHSYQAPFRTIIVEIPMKATGNPEGGDELEYKVHLAKGASYIYSWDTRGLPGPDQFYSEFHGHTLGERQNMVVADYRKAIGAKDNGALTAPFEGIHGWYFQNQSDYPVMVKLKISGFFELIPPGQPGNEAGLVAKKVG